MTARTMAQDVHQDLLAHLDDCTPCQSEQPCLDGERIGRALRAARTAAKSPMTSRRTLGGL